MTRQQETTLAELARDRLFVVPDYQRPYAWDLKQLKDLWDDIDLMGRGRHYTGTLVLLKRPRPRSSVGDDTLTEWEVVDGQQRLTTTFLLLDRLRRRVEGIDSPRARSIAEDLRTSYGEIVVEWQPRPRIRLAGELNDYWHQCILNDQPTSLAGFHSGHRLLKQAADRFDEWIARLVSDDPHVAVDRLTDLATRVTDGLRFLVYEVSSSADVGVIFETLNDRGRGLTEMEKIKNYLLYLARQMPESARTSLVDHVNSAWADIFDNFAAAPSVNEDSVLRAHWIATQDGDARTWKGTQSVKTKFPRSKYVPHTERLVPSTTSVDGDPWHDLREDIVGYVDGLRLCSLFARELHSATAQYVGFSDHKADASRAAETLRNTRFGIVRFYPVLFAARLVHASDGAFYAELIRLCETFTVRILLLAQWRTHTGSSSLNRLGRDIYRGTIDKSETLDRLIGLIRYYADDDIVQRQLSQYDNWYRRNHKFLLYEYERSLLRPGTSMPAFSVFLERGTETTEHILPQNPTAGSEWLRTFTADDRKTLTHTLGNLMLTMDNSRYSNHDYDVKRGTRDAAPDASCYFNGSLAQEREVAAQYAAWTPADVRSRQAHLAEWIMGRWALPDTAVAAAEPSSEDVLDDILGDEQEGEEGEMDRDLA